MRSAEIPDTSGGEEREGGTRIETLHITIRHRSRAGDPGCGAAEHPLGYIHYIY